MNLAERIESCAEKGDRDGVIGGSFRDPSGNVFLHKGELYRSVSQSYKQDYDLLLSSGLYADLSQRGLLVQHSEVNLPEAVSSLNLGTACYKVIKPALIPFISYPYEWCFSQLQDAALLTLDLHAAAFEKGMVLKDATAFNVQFIGSKPIFIDTLSFEKYQDGSPWVAYKQFCEHFLAPLLLMSKIDVRLKQLFVAFPNGIPLDLVSRLLPLNTWLKPSILMHIHLHASSQRRHANSSPDRKRETKVQISQTAMLGLIDNLKSLVKGLTWKIGGTEWADYYNNTNYSTSAMSDKERIVDQFIRSVAPQSCWDLGGNDGTFSRLAARAGAYTICADIDPSAVEKNYLAARQARANSLLPLVIDLTNPSPALGWAHQERSSLVERGPAELIVALALIHHLAISNNVPLDLLAKFFASAGNALLIEFVPKNDSQVQKLLSSRADIFPNYNQDEFERIFGRYFKIESRESVAGSVRTLYLMRKL